MSNVSKFGFRLKKNLISKQLYSGFIKAMTTMYFYREAKEYRVAIALINLEYFVASPNWRLVRLLRGDCFGPAHLSKRQHVSENRNFTVLIFVEIPGLLSRFQDFCLDSERTLSDNGHDHDHRFYFDRNKVKKF